MTNLPVFSGTVKFWNAAKGWGFLTCEGSPDVFAHASNTLDKVDAGDEVEFDIEDGTRGPKAINVRRKKKL